VKFQIKRLSLTVMFLLIINGSAWCDVDLVTIPGRDYVQLTIYNTVDLTLARERRSLTFKEGQNRIQFSWTNTLIDPTSLKIRVLDHSDKIILLDTTYPPNRRDALQWNFESSIKGPVLVEISYFTSGLTWKAEYAAISNYEETEITFHGYVRIFNSSGEEYENARTRLMVGTVHLLEKIADLAKGSFRSFTPKQRDDAVRYFLDAEAKYRRMTSGGGGDKEYHQAKGIAKEGLSEYFIFSIEGEETVQNNWSKRLQSVFSEKTPIETYYRLSDMTTAGKVIKFYKFANRKFDNGPGSGSLGGCPLPGGSLKVFNQYKEGDLSYLGADNINYIPMGDKIVLNLGEDKDLIVNRKLKDYCRTDIQLDNYGRVKHYTEHFYYETRIHNTKDKPVKLEVERKFVKQADVTGLKAIESFNKVSETARKYFVDLSPNEERVVKYRVIVRH